MSEVKERTGDGTGAKTENRTAENEKAENPLYVRFHEPFRFENGEYDGVDLSGLENMTGNDMIEVEKLLRAQGLSSALADLSVTGIFAYAMTASGHPLEFFQQLPLREAKKVKTRVLNFFWE